MQASESISKKMQQYEQQQQKENVMPKENWRNTNSARQFTEQAVERVTKQLAENRAPWQKGWDKPTGADLPPFNPASGKRFKGLNQIVLRSAAEERGYSDPRWMSYNAANKVGAKIRKGERGTRVEYLRFSPQGESKGEDKAGEAGKQQEQGKITHQTYVVFNAEQIERMPALEQQLPKEPQQWEVCERAERMLQASGVNIEKANENESFAYYKADSDKVVLPEQEKFPSPEKYYSSAVEQMGHWTGHDSRLNRDTLKQYSTSPEGQAKEEMRVQMSSTTVCGAMRLPKEEYSDRHVQTTIQTLKSNPNELRNAARDADKMAEHITQFDRQQQRQPAEAPAKREVWPTPPSDRWLLRRSRSNSRSGRRKSR